MSEERADAILTEFASDPSARVADWAVRYPSQGRAFAQLAADRALPLPQGDVARVQALGMTVLREKRAAYSATRLSLKSAAEAKGLTAETAAAALRVPVGLFWKLHRRLITFESIPAVFLQRLSDTLDQSIEELSRYLKQPAQLAAGASYKNDEAPEARQESFTQALSQDPETTEAMRATWR